MKKLEIQVIVLLIITHISLVIYLVDQELGIIFEKTQTVSHFLQFTNFCDHFISRTIKVRKSERTARISHIFNVFPV